MRDEEQRKKGHERTHARTERESLSDAASRWQVSCAESGVCGKGGDRGPLLLSNYCVYLSHPERKQFFAGVPVVIRILQQAVRGGAAESLQGAGEK